MARTFVRSMCLIAVASSVGLADTFPYTTHVNRDRAWIRSGPGEAFYATGQLNDGESVDVYRHANGGWLAIRPPRGSFSWVAAMHVRPIEKPSLVQVTSVDATTRVGSQLNSAHNVEYIHLTQGEILNSLGPRQTLGASPTLWYKIAPPSGEFRWIHRDDVSLLPAAPSAVPETLGANVADAAVPIEQAQDARPTNVTTRTDIALVSHEEAETPRKKLAEPAAKMTTVPIPEEEVPEPAQSEREPAVEQIAPATPEATWVAVDRDTRAHRRADSTDQPIGRLSLSELSVELSRVVAQDITQWNMAPLRNSIERLLAAAGPREYQTALGLARRIQEFESLQRRHEQLGDGPDGFGRQDDLDMRAVLASRSVEQTRPADVVVRSADLTAPRRRPLFPRADEILYDAHGWLIPVITARRDLPAFALTNNNGTILHFVSPGAGINLRRYLRREVGIVGAVDQTPVQGKSHLMARRVVLLDRHRR